jgi:hypothetical protein
MILTEKRMKFPFIFALCWAIAPPVYAEMFKCRMADGKTVIQDVPCRKDVESAERIRIDALSPATQAQAAALSRKNTATLNKIRREQAAERRERAQKAKAEELARQKSHADASSSSGSQKTEIKR